MKKKNNILNVSLSNTRDNVKSKSAYLSKCVLNICNVKKKELLLYRVSDEEVFLATVAASCDISYTQTLPTKQYGHVILDITVAGLRELWTILLVSLQIS